jgi:putative transposase
VSRLNCQTTKQVVAHDSGQVAHATPDSWLRHTRIFSQRDLTNREKAILIDALRTKYPLNDLLETTGLSKSSYYYQKETQKQPGKYASLRTEVKEIFYDNQRRYGYRRVHATIKYKGTTISEKVIRRIMKEEQLIIPYKKKRNYSSYKGEISLAP